MKIAMLSGGVGGARLARGFPHVGEVDTTVIVNVGDDDTVYGMWVSADLDTVVYTLAGIEGPEGWGRAGETWRVMDTLSGFGVDTSFRLGDSDLATNLYRTQRLAAGAALSEVTAAICQALGVTTRVLPATDDRVATRLRATTGEWIDFQTYFVRRRHQDEIAEITYQGVESARPAPGVIEAITVADAVVIGPSNPLLSIRPIIEVPGIRAAVETVRRVMAVSPLIGGAAVKGPAARLLAAFGYPSGNAGVVAAYDGLLTDLVVDTSDDEPLPGVRTWPTDIMVPTVADSVRLAKEMTSWLA